MLHYSYSPAVGGGSGTSYSTGGEEGRITGIRVYEQTSAYIKGIQVRYDAIWGDLIGLATGTAQELELIDDETIVQLSGKYYTNYVYQLMFVTSTGRSLVVGQPSYHSFNFYPTHPEAELKLLSGRFNSAGITSVGAHWATFRHQSNSTNVL